MGKFSSEKNGVYTMYTVIETPVPCNQGRGGGGLSFDHHCTAESSVAISSARSSEQPMMKNLYLVW